jgi:hypothetical protein
VNEHGEELFMIMRKNLYGHPAAARAWTRERDTQLLKHFNQTGWTDQRGKKAWLLIHTDDCDGVGEDDQILDAIDPEYMLGVSRKLTFSGEHADQQARGGRLRGSPTGPAAGLSKSSRGAAMGSKALLP